MNAQECVTRGNLPHWYQPGHAHFITYRLAGTIPTALLQSWRLDRDRQLEIGPPDGITSSEYRSRLHKQLFANYDAHLDASQRDRCLADNRIATIVRENLYHHHGHKYELLAYCIMPNHVHVLLQPFVLPAGAGPSVAEAASFGNEHCFSDEAPDERSPLSAIMHSLKSYTANRANAVLDRSGQFWQHESYDHWVRDLDELERIVWYIQQNPVRAGLCTSPREWRWSSAADRFVQDGSDSGLVGWLRDDWQQSR